MCIYARENVDRHTYIPIIVFSSVLCAIKSDAVQDQTIAYVYTNIMKYNISGEKNQDN